MSNYSIVTKRVPTFYFVGVSTSKSSIMPVFPRWMAVLGQSEVVIEGIDHPIQDDPAAYRATVAQIKHDRLSIGALVTTHKMDVFAAAHDLFDYLDPYARQTHELSCISKLDGRLEGHAKDPITAGLSLDAIVGSGYFGRTGAAVLCFGAGGAALATLLHLINKPDQRDRPRRIVVVDRTQLRLDHIQRMASPLGTDMAIEYVRNDDPRHNDARMSGLPDGSLVINATGMGKDIPGSPITNEGIFPRHGIAWEFNYRGELGFLHQAQRQRAGRNLRVEDGWVYFLHGWSQVVAQVLHIELTDNLFAQLNAAASAA